MCTIAVQEKDDYVMVAEEYSETSDEYKIVKYDRDLDGTKKYASRRRLAEEVENRQLINKKYVKYRNKFQQQKAQMHIQMQN